MGPKESGDDRGSVAQERRRCHDGWRTTEMRSRDDGQGEQGEAGDGRTCCVPMRVYLTHEDFGRYFGFTAKCPRVHVVALKVTGETSAPQKLSKADPGVLRDNVKVEAADRRVKEMSDHSSREEGNERTRAQMKVTPMRQQQERVRAAAATRYWHQVQTAVATQLRTGSSRESNGFRTEDNKRKADGQHPEDPPERQDGTVDEDCGKQAVDSRKRRGEHVEANCEVELKTLERIEPKKEFEERHRR